MDKVKRRKKKIEIEREKRTMSISVAAYHNTDNNIGLRNNKKKADFHSNRYEKVMINHMLEGISSSTDNLDTLAAEDFKAFKARKDRRIKVDCPDTSTNSSENTSESQSEQSES